MRPLIPFSKYEDQFTSTSSIFSRETAQCLMGGKQRQSERMIYCLEIRLISVCDMLWKLADCGHNSRVQPSRTVSTSLAIDQVSKRPDPINPSTFRERQ